MLEATHSGIREISGLALATPGAIRLEIGQPDFRTPDHIGAAAKTAIRLLPICEASQDIGLLANLPRIGQAFGLIAIANFRKSPELSRAVWPTAL